MWYIVTLQDFLLQDVVDTQFRWFRVLFNKVHGLLIKGRQHWLRNFFSPKLFWFGSVFWGGTLLSLPYCDTFFCRCLLSGWRRDVWLDERKGLTEYLSYALMLCS